MNKKTFFIQGIILTIISLFLRLTNIGYRSFLSQKIGTQGMGLYQLIFSIFLLAITLSTSGISLAVTRMVTSAITSKKRNSIRSIVFRCFTFCFICSLSISCLLFFFSDIAADILLGNAKASSCLKILALGLPFMSLSTCMKGYFLAVDESVATGFSDVLENVLTIGLTVFMFWYNAPKSIESACFAAMLSSSLGEISSFLFAFAAYRRSLRKHTPKEKKKAAGVLRGLRHIALPCTLSAAARSLLNTGENLLIPKELQRYGLDYKSSMSQYGLLQGMSMPMLYFPSSLLASFSNLMIPRISMARETKKYKNLEYIVGKALGATLMFGIFFSSIFMFFGNSWSTAFYKNSDAGVYLKVLSPIVPLVYLDVVVDSLLKGMDEQFNSMKFNLADSTLRVVLVFCLLRFFGMDSYIGILFVSTIFNVSLSLGRLIKVTRVKINISERIVLPALSFYPASFAVRLFIERYESIFPHSIIYVLAQIVLSALAGGCLYYVLTYIKSLFIKSREPQERT